MKKRKYKKKHWIEKLREIVAKELPETKRKAIERSGRLAEEKVKRALRKLKKAKEIERYRQSKKFSIEDRKRIDFTIYPLGMEAIFLQVKSHLYSDQISSWQLKEIATGIWYKDGIYIIEARPEEKERRIENKILKILKIEKVKLEQNRSFFIFKFPLIKFQKLFKIN